MDNNLAAASALTKPATPDAQHEFLTRTEIIARWRVKVTTGSAAIRSATFPKPVVGGRFRLDHIIAWEDAQAFGGPALAEQPTPTPTPTIDQLRDARRNARSAR